MTSSEQAHIRDPRVRLPANRIIEAQVREIGEMKDLIADLERNPTAASAPGRLSYRQRGAPPPSQGMGLTLVAKVLSAMR